MGWLLKMKNIFIKIFSLILIFGLMASCGNNSNNIQDIVSTNISNDPIVIDDKEYGLLSGFPNKIDLEVEYNGGPIKFTYDMKNMKSEAEWGFRVYINGILQTFSVYYEQECVAYGIQQYNTHLNEEETQTIEIELVPNIGKKGDILSLNVCAILNPSYMLKGTSYVSFLPNHRLSSSMTMKLIMNVDAKDKPEIKQLSADFVKVSDDIKNQYNTLDSNGRCINDFDEQIVFNIYKKNEEDSILYCKEDDVIKISGYGKPGKYIISMYINHKLVPIFDNSMYGEVEIMNDQQFIVEVPIHIENDNNHVYIVVFEQQQEIATVSNYIKTNTKLLIKES